MSEEVESANVVGGNVVSDGPCFPTVVPVIVEIKSEDCSIEECNSGSNLSDCSETGVNVLINPVDTKYGGKCQQQQIEAAQSGSETDEHFQVDQCTVPAEVPIAYSQIPSESETYCSDCSVCTQCVYDENCPECVSSAPYGFNNNNAHAAHRGTMQVQYTPGADLLQQPPQYQQPVIDQAPPQIQEQVPPIYFIPPPQAEEWIVTNAYEQTEIVQDILFQQQCLEELPAIHISGAGLITVLLRDDIAIEMTLDHSIRAINHSFHSVISVTNDGRESCIFHKGVRIKQKDIQVDADMFHNRRVSMNREEVNFSFEGMAFQLNRNLISPIPLSAFPEPTEGDDTVGLIYASTGVHPHLIPACEAVIKDSRYTREKNGSVVVDINNVRIRQEKNGDVNVLSTPKRIRLSPSSGWIGIQTDFVSMSIGQFWDVSIQCGKNVLSASNQHMFYVHNGLVTAGFDINKKLFTYKKPERHQRQHDNRRPLYPARLRPPPPRYMSPPPPFAGFRPRGGPPMGYAHPPPMRWSGPRDVRKMYPPMYIPPPRHFRDNGNDRGNRRQQHHNENPNWRQRPDRQPEQQPEEELPQQSPDSSEQSDSAEKLEKKGPQQPQPRKRMKNFKREQARDPSEADSAINATD
jgi:hypothetical protein